MITNPIEIVKDIPTAKLEEEEEEKKSEDKMIEKEE